MKQVLKIENLTVEFGSFKAVDNISFSVDKGEIFGFLGANGAGKTTTIRAICGLLNPSAGTIAVNGKDVTSDIESIKPHIGYMSQKFTLYNDLTVKENILFSGSLYNMTDKKSEKRMKELFKYVDFDRDENELVKNLSGGTKQIISLCAAMLHDPDIIFLDEPTAGISPSSRVLFWNLIRKLSKDGKTIFVTTHYMDEAEYCGRIALMQAGRIIGLDSPSNLKKEVFKNPLFEIEVEKENKKEFEKYISKNKAGDLSVYGMRYHLEAENECFVKQLAKEKKYGIRYRKIEPSLEDVFIKMIGEK